MAKTGRNRSINRHRWDFDTLEGLLNKPDSNQHVIHTALSELIKIRKAQPAFHPNAQQFTLQLGTHIFGYWRQNLKYEQSIFCLNNITDKNQSILLSDINLMDSDNWVDLITNQKINLSTEILELQPYQTMWISNS